MSFHVGESIHIWEGDAPQLHGDKVLHVGPFCLSLYVPLHL